MKTIRKARGIGLKHRREVAKDLIKELWEADFSVRLKFCLMILFKKRKKR